MARINIFYRGKNAKIRVNRFCNFAYSTELSSKTKLSSIIFHGLPKMFHRTSSVAAAIPRYFAKPIPDTMDKQPRLSRINEQQYRRSTNLSDTRISPCHRPEATTMKDLRPRGPRKSSNYCARLCVSH